MMSAPSSASDLAASGRARRSRSACRLARQGMSKVGRPRLPGVAQGGLRPPDGACGRSRPLLPALPEPHCCTAARNRHPARSTPRPDRHPPGRQSRAAARCWTGDALGQPFGRLTVGDSTGDDKLGEDDEIVSASAAISRDAIEIAGDVPSMRRELDDGHPRAPRFRQRPDAVQPVELLWIPEVRIERHRAVGVRPAVGDEIFGRPGRGACRGREPDRSIPRRCRRRYRGRSAGPVRIDHRRPSGELHPVPARTGWR